jgi:phosphopantetheinyl transferase
MATLSIGGLGGLVEAGRPDGQLPALARSRLDRWLTPAELAVYHGFCVPKRRRDWLAGRVAAKDLIARRSGFVGTGAFRAIEIVALPDGPRRGRPVYRVRGEPGRLGLSIAHARDTALAALGRDQGQEVGVDIEETAPRARSFEELALSPPEQRRLHGLTGPRRWRAVTRIWALKEALSKALGSGLRLALPRLSVALDPDSGELEGRLPFRPLLVGGIPHPLLTGLERRSVAARSFELEGLMAAWVILGPSAEDA